MQDLQFAISGLSTPVQKIIYTALIVWSIVWKGLALWKAAHKEQKYWFIAMLVLNTVGLLEILYLTVFSKKSLPTLKLAKKTNTKK